MYLNTTVKIPEIKGKIITKKKGGTTYILYQYGSEYNQDKRYAVPLRTIVGKVSADDPTLMFQMTRPLCFRTISSWSIFRMPRSLKSSRSLTGAAASRSVPASSSGR